MNLLQLSNLSEDEAREIWERNVWPHGPVCPRCGCVNNATKLKGKTCRPGLYQCRECGKQFTATTGTPLRGTRLSMKQWVLAFYLFASSKNSISSCELGRHLGVGQKTAWYMLHRLRLASRDDDDRLLTDEVEVDEVYVGGRSRKGIRGRGSERKKPVILAIERGGKAVAIPVERTNRATLHPFILENVDRGATIYTDEYAPYRGIGQYFAGGHKVVCHGRYEFVRDDAYTNTAESFFARLRRSYRGTYHWYSHKHMLWYVWEVIFRWSTNMMSDWERMQFLMSQSGGKTTTFFDLTDSRI